MDPAARRRAAELALKDDARGDTARLLRNLGNGLEPRSALAVVLVEHVWARGVEDAVARVGGWALAGEVVDTAELSELAPELLTMVR